MDIRQKLGMMLAALDPNDNNYNTSEAFDYLTAANYLRMQKICDPLIRQAIDGHTIGIMSKDAARRARDAYTRTYLLNLNLPYEGIQMLCTELVRKLKNYNVEPNGAILDFANGKFDWKKEYENLLNVNTF